MRAREVFEGSDAALTRTYNTDLRRAGETGRLAVALLKAQKASNRAKKYRGGPASGGSYSALAYQRKNDALAELCELLMARTERTWGWKIDPRESHARWVLYVELPGHGQVSFHNIKRLQGPDYPREWDGERRSVERICSFCDTVMDSLMGVAPWA